MADVEKRFGIVPASARLCPSIIAQAGFALYCFGIEILNWYSLYNLRVLATPTAMLRCRAGAVVTRALSLGRIEANNLCHFLLWLPCRLKYQPFSFLSKYL